MRQTKTIFLWLGIPLCVIALALLFPSGDGCYAEETRPAFSPLNHCLFPLELGTQWKYRDQGPEVTVTSTATIISLSVTTESKTAVYTRRTPIEKGVAEIKSELSLRANCIYEKLMAVGVPGIATPGLDLNFAGMLLPDLGGLRRGHSWPGGGSVKADIKTFEAQAASQIICRVEGWEWVTVPAGKFYALKLSYGYSPLTGQMVVRLPPEEKRERINEPGGEPSYDWYAPFIGLVKSLSTDPENSGTTELLSCSLQPSPCDVAVISLDGTAKINGRLPQAEIYHGETIDIETDRGSTLEICQPGPTFARIGPETKIQLRTTCNPEEAPGGPKAPPKPVLMKVAVLLGKMWITVSKSVGGGKIRYDTPSVAVGSRGTQLSLEVKADGSTIVEVEEGEVEVTEKKTGQVVILKSGERREFLMAAGM